MKFNGVTVREPDIDAEGRLSLDDGEMLVVESDVEHLLFQACADGVIRSFRTPKVPRDGRTPVLRPEDWGSIESPRLSTPRVGERLAYSIRGTSLSGRAVPRRTEPVTAIRAVAIALDDVAVDGDL